MTFEVGKLEYKFDALEPHIDARTMEIHHDKHHAAYVTNLNKALENAPELQTKKIEDILKEINQVPEAIRTAVRNNGGGHFNHSLFWEWLTPGGSKTPIGNTAKQIDAVFGGFDPFMEKFTQAGLTRFGSGWAWLCVKKVVTPMILNPIIQDILIMVFSAFILELKKINSKRALS